MVGTNLWKTLPGNYISNIPSSLKCTLSLIGMGLFTPFIRKFEINILFKPQKDWLLNENAGIISSINIVITSKICQWLMAYQRRLGKIIILFIICVYEWL